MKKTKEEQALENLKILQEVDLISRREFLSVASLLGSATVVANLMTPQSALAWVATRMRKGRVSNDVYAAIDVGDVGYSLRFRRNGSTYLSRTPASVGNRKTWTWSGWVKRGLLSIDQILFSAGTTDTSRTLLYLNVNGVLCFFNNTGAGYFGPVTSAVLRDPSSHYHILLAVDTTQATPSSRYKIYVNGNLQTLTVGTDIPQNTDTYVNNTQSHFIGKNASAIPDYFDGYLSRVCFVDGQALSPSSFGYLNPNSNSWVTKSQSAVKAVVDAGGTNSFMLDFDNGTTTATLGYDKSVKGNNWNTNNISLTAGVTYDWMLDTPSNNFCILNPLSFNSSYLSGANLEWAGGSNTSARSSFEVSSGPKIYWEWTPIDSTPNWVGSGLMDSTTVGTNNFGAAAIGVFGVYPTTYFWKIDNTTATNTGVSIPALGCVFAAAFDPATKKLWMGYAASGDGSITWLGSGDPANGTNPFITVSSSNPLFVAASSNGGTSNKSAFNFGQRPFSYTPPSGFKSLCTANLSKPTIVNSKKHFDVSLWTATGVGSVTVTNYGFQPDLVVAKALNDTYNWDWVDSVRGVNNVLSSNLTNAESTVTTVSAFNANGFNASGTANDNYALNCTATTARNYMAAQWKAGGTAVSNSVGSITSQVSANTAAGFSIVTYTGTGASATIGHGLGTAPKMVIVFARTGGGVAGDHAVYHASANAAPASGVLGLNGTYGFYVTGGPNIWWNNTNPSTTVFSVGTSPMTNASAGTFVAYCFSEIAGYSKFGPYTGNGSTTGDGPFCYCGFRPRFILLKNISLAATAWYIFDTARDTFNVAQNMLYPNANSQEAVSNPNQVIDVLSNGFKIRSTAAGWDNNNSGNTIIFAAFAEAPFKYSNAR